MATQCELFVLPRTRINDNRFIHCRAFIEIRDLDDERIGVPGTGFGSKHEIRYWYNVLMRLQVADSTAMRASASK